MLYFKSWRIRLSIEHCALGAGMRVSTQALKKPVGIEMNLNPGGLSTMKEVLGKYDATHKSRIECL